VIEFYKDGTRIFTGKIKPEFEFRFQAGHDTEQELLTMKIDVEAMLKAESEAI
jgi:hypothetical protein